jgi:hypothetical protein
VRDVHRLKTGGDEKRADALRVKMRDAASNFVSTFLRTTNTPSTIGGVRSFSSHWFIAACLLVSFCFITDCRGNARDIVGAWRTSTDSNAMVWEFSRDGSVLVGTNRGRYSFGDNNRIKIETSIATSVYQMELVGDKMTLKEPNGSKLVLTRVK